MIEYGKPDEDGTVLTCLLSAVEGQEVLYILHHQRIPVDARPCRLPLSLTVQAVLDNGKVVTARQDKPGAKAHIV